MVTAPKPQPEERVEITSCAQLRLWLEAHHTQKESIWLVTFKKSARPDLYVSWPEVVREALCFGWIDSRCKRLDDQRTMIRLSPRKRGSTWSTINKAHVAALAKQEGRITPTGWAVIHAAQQDGSWEFLDDVEACVVPNDLAQALKAVPGAREQFQALPRSKICATLYSIKSAKRPATRAKRIDETVKKLASGE